MDDRTEFSVKVVEFILTYPIDDLQNLTIKKIIDHFGISRSYLFKQFKLFNDFTLQEYINRRRIFHAALLLSVDDDGLTVEKMSDMMGYCNSEYFIRVFKKYFGITPGRYRNLFKDKKTGTLMEYLYPKDFSAS
jgi:AraC-like DNA-binding protein